MASTTNRRLAIQDQPTEHEMNSLSVAPSSGQDRPNNRQTWWKRAYRHRGILYILTAAFCSSTHFIIAKFVKEDIHVAQLSFLKFAFQFFLPIPVLIYRGVALKPESSKVLILLISRGVVGTLAFISFLYSFNFTRVGDASAVVYASPAFIGIGARVFMKEAFDIVDALLVVVVIAGIFLISQPPFLFGGDSGLSSQVIGVLLAFATCLGITVVTLLLRKLGQLKVDPFKIVIWYALIGMVGAALLTTVIGAWSEVPCYTVRYLVVALGATAFLSQCLMTASLSLERSVFIAMLRTNEVVFSYILEYLVFGLTPNIWVLVGVIMVLASSVTASLKKMWKSKRKGIARRQSTAVNSPLGNSILTHWCGSGGGLYKRL